MKGKVIIYGKSTCPHTKRALAAHPDAEFRDIKANPTYLEEMLEYSCGKERIPVVVTDGEAEVGFKRGS